MNGQIYTESQKIEQGYIHIKDGKILEIGSNFNIERLNELKGKLGIRQSHTETEFKQLLTRVNDGINKASKQ